MKDKRKKQEHSNEGLGRVAKQKYKGKDSFESIEKSRRDNKGIEEITKNIT